MIMIDRTDVTLNHMTDHFHPLSHTVRTLEVRMDHFVERPSWPCHWSLVAARQLSRHCRSPVSPGARGREAQGLFAQPVCRHPPARPKVGIRYS